MKTVERLFLLLLFIFCCSPVVKASEDFLHLRKSLELIRCQSLAMPRGPALGAEEREISLARWRRLERSDRAGNSLGDKVDELWDFLKREGATLISEAQTAGQLQIIENDLVALAERLKKRGESSAHLSMQRKLFAIELDRLLDAGRRTSYFPVVQALRNAAVMRMRESNSFADIQEAADFAIAQIDRYLVRHEEEESLRRNEELRFSPGDRSNARGIFEALNTVRARILRELRLFRSPNLDIDLARNENLEWLAADLLTDERLREFVYRETQFLRRISNLIQAHANGMARQRLAEGALLRLNNSLRAVYGIFPGSEERVAYLQLLRRSLRNLHHESNLAGVSGAEHLRSIDILDSETIVSDALSSNEVYMIVMSAGMLIVQPWTGAADRDLATLYLHRWEYQRVYLTYLAIRYPHWFATRTSAQQIRLQSRRRANDRYHTLPEDVRRRIRVHISDRLDLQRSQTEEADSTDRLGIELRFQLVLADPLWTLEAIVPVLRLYLNLRDYCSGDNLPLSTIDRIAKNFGLSATRVGMYRELLGSVEILEFEAVFRASESERPSWFLEPPSNRSDE